MYPIDKTNLDVLRFAHFLALAVVTVRFVPRDWPGLKSPILQPAIRLRPAFAGDFLPRRVSGLCRTIHHRGILGRPAAADGRQRVRHYHHDCYREPDIVVQGDGRAKPPIARQISRRGPRGRRGMTFVIAVLTTIALLNGAARRAGCGSGTAAPCDVPEWLLPADSRSHARQQRNQGSPPLGHQRRRLGLLGAVRSRRCALRLSGATGAVAQGAIAGP